MKKSQIIFLFIIIFVFPLPIKSVKAKTRNLGITENTVLIYEYTEIDKELIEYLGEEDDVYKSYKDVEKGDRFKLTFPIIVENEDFWHIVVETHSGENLDILTSSYAIWVYKSTSDLLQQINKEENVSFLLFPEDSNQYMEELNATLDPDEYDYGFEVRNSAILLDFTPLGYSDLILRQ